VLGLWIASLLVAVAGVGLTTALVVEVEDIFMPQTLTYQADR
jgi:hypothetical protein